MDQDLVILLTAEKVKKFYSRRIFFIDLIPVETSF